MKSMSEEYSFKKTPVLQYLKDIKEHFSYEREKEC